MKLDLFFMILDRHTKLFDIADEVSTERKDHWRMIDHYFVEKEILKDNRQTDREIKKQLDI